MTYKQIVAELRLRHEMTAGFTRDIYTPEHQDLDLLAAYAIERLEHQLDVNRNYIAQYGLEKFDADAVKGRMTVEYFLKPLGRLSRWISRRMRN